MPYLITILISLIIILILFNIGKVKRVIVYQNTQQKEKQENKNKIMDLLKQRGRVGNDEVQKLLNVSDATATRYLDELEKQNKIKQVGKRGRFVYYELI